MAALGKKIEDISAALGRMSRREKFMVAGVAVAFVLFVGTLVTLWVSSTLTGLERRITNKTGKLQTIIGLRQQYEESKQAKKEAEKRIAQARNIPLMGTLENQAKQLGINTNEMKMSPRASAADPESGIEEKRVEVTIPKITIDRLVDFLEQIEQKSESIKIRSLHIRKNFKDPTQLVAEFSVSKFEKKEVKEAAPSGTGPARKKQ
jgi:hypothetical protein